MRTSLFTIMIVFSIALAFVSEGCTGNKQVKGEIVGILAKTRLDDMRDNKMGDISYSGKIVVQIQDAQKVEALCSKELLSKIEGAPEMTVEEIHGGLIANITIKIDKKQKALITNEKSNEWKVVEILK